ncbi:SGNH/GDSL hydrolase family protein [Pseudomonas sp. ESBL2]|uniref:SGNH/GDSL hydrolase family protein n=1 Tax=Pseudomonas sp. ESBL2 TaxID=3077325 RepID=UPI002FCA75C6
MSGAEDLARLTETIDKTNELLLSPEVKMLEVSPGVWRPTSAMVMTNLATLLGGAMPYPSLAEGLAETGDGTNFSVLSSVEDEYVNVYRNEGGVGVFVDSYPNTDALRKAVGRIKGYTPSSETETTAVLVANKEGGRLARITNKSVILPSLRLTTEDGRTVIRNNEGGAVLYADGARALFGGLEQRPTTRDGVYVTNREGGLIKDLSGTIDVEQVADDPFALGVMFVPLLVTAEGFEQTLYLKNLLPKRSLAGSVTATLSSTTTSASETGSDLKISPGKLGSNAVLNLRSNSLSSARHFANVAVKNVPVQSTPKSVKVLMIGDSIVNRQGGYLLKQVLQSLNITATCIGTLRGSSSPTNPNDFTGELGEGREGWETGDFTYAITDRALVITPGDETNYLESMTKAEQMMRNPFLRAATGSDPSSIVRNGYVFDPAFYQSRFGLEAPDVVVYSVGTNDARDRTAGTIYDAVLANDTIILAQIRAAWPSAKIVRMFPGTAINSERDALWETHYLPMLRAIQQAAVNLADPKLIIAPTWALTNPESGYAFSATSPGADGFYTGDWTDAIHPIQSSRQRLYEAVGAYTAAASLNII